MNVGQHSLHLVIALSVPKLGIALLGNKAMVV